MGIFDSFKKNLLQKKITKNKHQRDIKILPIKTYHNVLLIFDSSQNERDLKTHLELVFENAKFTNLTFRDNKIDESNGYTYTFHTSDMGFGKIKNQRLLGLINTNFDLVIDFVTNQTELDFFVQHSKSALKIGDLKATKNYLYDLLIEKGKSDSDYINNIKTQINTLSK